MGEYTLLEPLEVNVIRFLRQARTRLAGAGRQLWAAEFNFENAQVKGSDASIWLDVLELDRRASTPERMADIQIELLAERHERSLRIEAPEFSTHGYDTPFLIALARKFEIDRFPDDAEKFIDRGDGEYLPAILVRGRLPLEGEAPVQIRRRNGQVLLDSTCADALGETYWELAFRVDPKTLKELRAEADDIDEEQWRRHCSDRQEQLPERPVVELQGDFPEFPLPHASYIHVGPFARDVDRQLRGPIQGGPRR